MTDATRGLALLFEPDGYVTSGPRLMGRQAAGEGFLRAAILNRGLAPLWAYTANPASAQVFKDLVGAIDPAVKALWCPPDRLDLLAGIGLLYIPGPTLADSARLRLRAGAAAWSLCGITHTTASHVAMDAIAELLSAPVMPWDALIATSHAVAATIKTVLEAQIAYLRWRFGSAAAPALPQLPIIPLGVHCADFQFTEAERNEARRAHGFGPDDIVALFVGRLSFHAKAHPHVMYRALQAASQRTGRRVSLVLCGWFANEHSTRAFADGAAKASPDVRYVHTDGRDPAQRRRSWAAADLFISMSDNIQETFGLTPIEAMAAGLPAVVSDWDGYKETVRDGVDGFRIPTSMPAPGAGEELAAGHESGRFSYDVYCGLACQTVAIDERVLVQRLADLLADDKLRRTLGASGRVRARERFDWSVVMNQYRQLWAELERMRRTAAANDDWRARLAAAPRAAATRLDPFRSFAAYPTKVISQDTRVGLAEGASVAAYEAWSRHPLYDYAAEVLPGADEVERLLAGLADGPRTIAELAAILGIGAKRMAVAIAVLSKLGLTRPEP